MKKIFSNHDEYVKINDFSERAICVYNEDLLMAKVLFNQLTQDYGFHKHEHRQIVFILKGKFLFCIEGKQYHVTAGDSLLIESNLEHGCIPLEVPSVLMDTFNPCRKDFLREVE